MSICEDMQGVYHASREGAYTCEAMWAEQTMSASLRLREILLQRDPGGDELLEGRG